jgi:uncharacterized protein YaaW (UPF0174 family)
MADKGLDKTRLEEKLINHLMKEVDARLTDEEGKETVLRKVISAIAEEVLEEVRQALVTIYIPAESVVVEVTDGEGEPAKGILNSEPIAIDNRTLGGVS